MPNTTTTSVRVFVTGRFYQEVILTEDQPTVADALNAVAERGFDWNGTENLEIRLNGRLVERTEAGTRQLSNLDTIIVVISKPTGN